MRSGDVVAGRFELDTVIGRGGMGEVWLADDRSSGKRCALKVLRARTAAPRFVRESEVLRTLEHPNIVSYLDHGLVDGHAYLAMEWLEGEDLGHRLERGPLALEDALELTRRVALGLGVAHARGIVHRDVKPRNLFLVAGEPTDVRILDFGVARLLESEEALTMTGQLVGTPGYCSPEQARGERTLDARSDVFALGLVLFECLSGRRPFGRGRPAAFLAKLILSEPRRLNDVMRTVPPAVEALVDRMLRKVPDERPAHGDAVAALVDDVLATLFGGGDATSLTPDPHLSVPPRRVVSLLVVEGPGRKDDPDRDVMHSLHALTQRHPERLADGTLLIPFGATAERSSPIDHAARSALALRQAVPDRAMALATGWVHSQAALTGEVIDRAVDMVAHPPPRMGVRLDGASARLLRQRFEVLGHEDDAVLTAERPHSLSLDEANPFVGRRGERQLLIGLVREAITENRPRVIVISGHTGMGKRRLARAVLDHACSEAPYPTVWFVRGDAERRGVPLALARRLLRGAAFDGDLTREALGTHLAALMGEATRLRTEPFLAYLLGLGPTDPAVLQARQNPERFETEVARAFVSLVGATTAKTPLIIAIEDLHHGDLASLRLLEAVMRSRRPMPFVTLALAEPGARELLALLQSDWDMTIRRLPPFTDEESAELARAIGGDSLSDADVQRVVRGGAGSPLQVEELARALRDGTTEDDALPTTLAALLSARLDRLPPVLRAIVGSASIFGREFSRAELEAVLDDVPDLGEQLHHLVQLEVLEELSAAHYCFRQELLRDLAYAALVPEARIRGHEIAAERLATVVGVEPSVVGAHLLRAGRRRDAGKHFLEAAADAFLNDIPAAMHMVEQGLATAPEGELRDRLELFGARASYVMGDIERALHLADSVVAPHRDPQRPTRWSAISLRVATRALLSDVADADVEELLRIPDELLAQGEEPAFLALSACSALFFAGQEHLGRRVADRLGPFIRGRSDRRADLDRIQLQGALDEADGDLGGAVGALRALAPGYTKHGHGRRLGRVQLWLGRCERELGCVAEAAASIGRALGSSRAAGDRGALFIAITEQARIALEEAQAVEAVNALEPILGSARTHPLGSFVLHAIQVALAEAYLQLGRRDEAGHLAEATLHEPLRCLRGMRPRAAAVLARVRLVDGGDAEALARTELQAIGDACPSGEAALWRVAVDATARRDEQEARDLLQRGRDRMMARATRNRDDGYRATFIAGTAARRSLFAEP